VFALSPPCAQVRRVETFTAQQSSYRAGILSHTGLAEDRAIILGGETTASWTGEHFRIQPEGQRRGARCVGIESIQAFISALKDRVSATTLLIKSTDWGFSRSRSSYDGSLKH
jgi:hypothetical protein